MRFIVDLYRCIIFGFCGIAIVAATLLILLGLDLDRVSGTPLGGGMIVIAIGLLLLLVLNLGVIAVLVSMHDRHVELVEETSGINAALMRLAASAEHLTAGEHE